MSKEIDIGTMRKTTSTSHEKKVIYRGEPKWRTLVIWKCRQQNLHFSNYIPENPEIFWWISTAKYFHKCVKLFFKPTSPYLIMINEKINKLKSNCIQWWGKSYRSQHNWKEAFLYLIPIKELSMKEFQFNPIIFSVPTKF